MLKRSHGVHEGEFYVAQSMLATVHCLVLAGCPQALPEPAPPAWRLLGCIYPPPLQGLHICLSLLPPIAPERLAWFLAGGRSLHAPAEASPVYLQDCWLRPRPRIGRAQHLREVAEEQRPGSGYDSVEASSAVFGLR